MEIGAPSSYARRWQWAVIGLIAAAVLWLLAPILTPFVFSAMLGWLGDPTVDRLQRRGWSRQSAVILVFSAMAISLLLALLLLLPLIERQLRTLVDSLPVYRDWFIGTSSTSASSTTIAIVQNTSVTAIVRDQPRRCRRSTVGSPSQPSIAANTKGVRIGASSHTTAAETARIAAHCQRRTIGEDSGAVCISASAARARWRWAWCSVPWCWWSCLRC